MRSKLQIGEDLPESRLLTFIDEQAEYVVVFFEGQALIRDLALTHGICGPGFAYFREVVLSVQPMLAFLKAGEQFGFYIDSEQPPFRLKIETGHHGETRCTLVPEGFSEFPEAMSGLVRMVRIFHGFRPPYQSILRVGQVSLGELVNRVLAESYQLPARVRVSETSDQAILVHVLPDGHRADTDSLNETVDARMTMLRPGLDALFAEAPTESAAIVAEFANLGLRLIHERPIRFHCPCSRERMIYNLRLVIDGGTPLEQLFEPDAETLELRCEYCKSFYHLTRDELRGAEHSVN